MPASKPTRRRNRAAAGRARTFVFRAGLAVAGVLAGALPAHADVVRLANGRSLTVDVCRFDGEFVTLITPGGGEIRLRADAVAEVLPEEVPRVRLAALDTLAESATAAGPRLSTAQIRQLVDRVAARVGIDPRLAHAVVRTESNYEPLAVSHRGAMGLMQLMPALAASFDLDDPFDPEANLEAGLRHLRRLLTRYDVRHALAAYNAGEGAVGRYGGVPPYRETQNYVRRIMAALR